MGSLCFSGEEGRREMWGRGRERERDWEERTEVKLQSGSKVKVSKSVNKIFSNKTIIICNGYI